MSHEIDTLPTKEGPYTAGFFAVCTCGWTGPERAAERRGQALIDGYDHMNATRGDVA